MIELNNEGNLSLFFIGTGSAFSKRFYQNNLLVVKGKNHILVDCGTLFSYAFEKEFDSKITDIQNVLITHSHADHIGGLEELALLGRYVTKQKLNLIITNQYKNKLWKRSLFGGLCYSEEGKMGFCDYFNQLKPKLIKRKPFYLYELNVGSINVKLFRTRHVTNLKKNNRNSLLSYGVLFDNSVLFTSDTQFNFEQIEWFTNNYDIKAIFHDCDVSGFAEGVHASYEQLKTLPENIKSRIYLCHYNSAIEGIDSIADGFAGIATAGLWYKY